MKRVYELHAEICKALANAKRLEIIKSQSFTAFSGAEGEGDYDKPKGGGAVK